MREFPLRAAIYLFVYLSCSKPRQSLSGGRMEELAGHFVFNWSLPQYDRHCNMNWYSGTISPIIERFSLAAVSKPNARLQLNFVHCLSGVRREERSAHKHCSRAAQNTGMQFHYYRFSIICVSYSRPKQICIKSSINGGVAGSKHAIIRLDFVFAIFYGPRCAFAADCLLQIECKWIRKAKRRS